MKSSEYLKELRTQSAAQLQEQLVAAKKKNFSILDSRTQQISWTILEELKKLEKILPEFRPLSLRKRSNSLASNP